MTEYDTYLAHHGILGQHWGKKNGPPYPLRPGAHSASEKKAGWRKSLDDKREERKKNRQPSEDYLRYKQLKKRKTKTLSNEELEFVNRRRELESGRSGKSTVASGEDYTKKQMMKVGAKVLTSVAVTAAIAGGVIYAKKHGITPETIAKGAMNVTGNLAKQAAKKTSEKAIDTAKEVTKEVGEKAIDTAKEAATKVSEAHKEFRKEVSSTPAAQTYVKTAEKVASTVKEAVKNPSEAASKAVEKVSEVANSEPAREIRKEVASSKPAQEYVKAVDKTVNTVKDAAKTANKAIPKEVKTAAHNTRKKVASSPQARSYVKTVDKLLGKHGKKKTKSVKRYSNDVSRDYAEELLRKNMKALGM